MSAHWNSVMGQGWAMAGVPRVSAPLRKALSFDQPRLHRRGYAVVLSLLIGAGAFAAVAEPEPLTSPEQFYNQGRQKLLEGKLREAEALLQAAVASQNE